VSGDILYGGQVTGADVQVGGRMSGHQWNKAYEWWQETERFTYLLCLQFRICTNSTA